MQITAPETNVVLPEDVNKKIESVKSSLAFAEAEVSRLQGMQRELTREIQNLLAENAKLEEAREKVIAETALVEPRLVELESEEKLLTEQVEKLTAEVKALEEAKEQFVKFVASI